MTAIVEGIKDLIEPHTNVSGWHIEIGILPPEPNKAIMIVNSPGLSPNPKWLIDEPGAQILVRGEVGGYIAAYNEAKTIKDILLGCDSQDVNGDRWVSVLMPSDLSFIGMDENHRPIFSLNFQFIIEPAVSAETNREAL